MLPFGRCLKPLEQTPGLQSPGRPEDRVLMRPVDGCPSSHRSALCVPELTGHQVSAVAHDSGAQRPGPSHLEENSRDVA